MSKTFFFYDLETSGLNPRLSRIMQFAGQRTGLDFKPIGKPINSLIRLTPDILPDPSAIILTGITPQLTLENGVSEEEFLRTFHATISTPDTIFVGYNNIRFDDEFVRFLNYRNFYDAYEWQWRDGRSRWDLLDVIRMTRALRPEGIKWPIDKFGKATNRLEQLTKLNGIPHSEAHDALADVYATIEIAKLIYVNQPKLFDYLLNMRQKKTITKFLSEDKPFIYTSGKYPSEYLKTTMVKVIAAHPERDGSLVYDLRFDPLPYSKMSVEQLVAAWKYDPDRKRPQLPIKTLQYNRCPAIAPSSVLDGDTLKRLKLDLKVIKENEVKLNNLDGFSKKVLGALKIMDNLQEKTYSGASRSVDELLYDGFFSDKDKKTMDKVHRTKPSEISSLKGHFSDKRLDNLLPLYKARNFPIDLSADEKNNLDKYRISKLNQIDLPKFTYELNMAKDYRKSSRDKKIISYLEKYAKSLIS